MISKIVCELQITRNDLFKQSTSKKVCKRFSQIMGDKINHSRRWRYREYAYDELRGNLLAYEQYHINRYNKKEKKEYFSIQHCKT